MFATISALLEFCAVGDCGNDRFFLCSVSPAPFCISGENRVFQNFPGKIL